jgi:Flp pilus assembly protein TadD
MVFGFALAVLMAMTAGVSAYGELVKGGKAPSIKALDVRGQEVDLDKLVAAQPYLVIEFFFTVATGEELAQKLSLVHGRYGKDKLKIIALGLKEEEAALKKFAEQLDIQYYIIDTKNMQNAEWLNEVTDLPLTLFVVPNKDLTIERVIRGGGKSQASLLKEIAENFYQQRKLGEASEVADEAVKAGEDPAKAREVKGFVLTAQGKLDEAQAEFGAIDSKTGMAKVALEKGELDKAVELAGQAGDNGYAETVKGTAQMRQGKLDEAGKSFDAAAAKPASDWQKSEAINGAGRVVQQSGQSDAAIGKYQEAVALDPYNVVALSNEGSAHREKGDLPKAEEVLEKAKQMGGDDNLVAMMLQQVKKELEEANDVKRGELIRNQIADLSARFKELKEQGKDKPVDQWSTRPAVLAFLPSSKAANAFFERAGTDVVIKREIEARLQKSDSVKVVEREMLDKLLQELKMGSSDLASQDTQLQLGKLLSARMIGFIDFAQMGPDVQMYVRMVDTETTAIALQLSKTVKRDADINTMVDEVVKDLTEKMTEKRQLQGLVADAADDNGILINLGKPHGVTVGMVFNVLQDGPPIEVGGKTIGHRPVKVGALEVTEVNDDYAVCKMLERKEGVTFVKEMKIKESRK